MTDERAALEAAIRHGGFRDAAESERVARWAYWRIRELETESLTLAALYVEHVRSRAIADVCALLLAPATTEEGKRDLHSRELVEALVAHVKDAQLEGRL